MSKTITIGPVSNKMYSRLMRRAKAANQSLSEFLNEALAEAVANLTSEEVAARTAAWQRSESE
jgi:hypothetical protein